MNIGDLKVLLVNDEVVGMHNFESAMRLAGITQYDKAEDEQSALDFIGKSEYNLLVLDTVYKNPASVSDTYLFGPKIAKLTKGLKKKPVIIGTSSEITFGEYWTGISDYFFTDYEMVQEPELLKTVLKEKFQIEA